MILVGGAYTAFVAWIFTIAMDLSREHAAATDFTLQLSVLGVLHVVTASAGLAVAGAAGTVVADRWHRGHDPARERIAVDADVAA